MGFIYLGSQNLIRTRFLQAMFHYFITILRDPIATSKKKWSKTSHFSLMLVLHEEKLEV